MAALDQGVIEWIDVAELGRSSPCAPPGRQSPEDITLFKSLGIGLEDIAVADEGLPEGEGGRRRPAGCELMRFSSPAALPLIRLSAAPW